MCKASREYRSQFYGAMEDLGITEKAPYPVEYETVYPQAKTVLEKLSEYYHIGIIANQSEGVYERLCRFGINDLIEICVSSSDVGFEKPNPEIFRCALDKADCLPENAFMIGDRLDNDIFPANKMGMKTVWIKQGFGKYQSPLNNTYKPDFEIDSLEELIKILIKNQE